MAWSSSPIPCLERFRSRQATSNYNRRPLHDSPLVPRTNHLDSFQQIENLDFASYYVL